MITLNLHASNISNIVVEFNIALAEYVLYNLSQCTLHDLNELGEPFCLFAWLDVYSGYVHGILKSYIGSKTFCLLATLPWFAKRAICPTTRILLHSRTLNSTRCVRIHSLIIPVKLSTFDLYSFWYMCRFLRTNYYYLWRNICRKEPGQVWIWGRHNRVL